MWATHSATEWDPEQIARAIAVGVREPPPYRQKMAVERGTPRIRLPHFSEEEKCGPHGESRMAGGFVVFAGRPRRVLPHFEKQWLVTSG